MSAEAQAAFKEINSFTSPGTLRVTDFVRPKLQWKKRIDPAVERLPLGWRRIFAQLENGEKLVVEAQQNASICDGLSFIATIDCCLAQLKNKSGLSEADGVNIQNVVIFGAAASEMKVMEKTNYFDLLTSRHGVRLSFVGPELKGKIDTTAPKSKLVSKLQDRPFFKVPLPNVVEKFFQYRKECGQNLTPANTLVFVFNGGFGNRLNRAGVTKNLKQPLLHTWLPDLHYLASRGFLCGFTCADQENDLVGETLVHTCLVRSRYLVAPMSNPFSCATALVSENGGSPYCGNSFLYLIQGTRAASDDKKSPWLTPELSKVEKLADIKTLYQTVDSNVLRGDDVGNLMQLPGIAEASSNKVLAATKQSAASSAEPPTASALQPVGGSTAAVKKTTDESAASTTTTASKNKKGSKNKVSTSNGTEPVGQEHDDSKKVATKTDTTSGSITSGKESESTSSSGVPSSAATAGGSPGGVDPSSSASKKKKKNKKKGSCSAVEQVEPEDEKDDKKTTPRSTGAGSPEPSKNAATPLIQVVDEKLASPSPNDSTSSPDDAVGTTSTSDKGCTQSSPAPGGALSKSQKRRLAARRRKDKDAQEDETEDFKKSETVIEVAHDSSTSSLPPLEQKKLLEVLSSKNISQGQENRSKTSKNLTVQAEQPKVMSVSLVTKIAPSATARSMESTTTAVLVEERQARKEHILALPEENVAGAYRFDSAALQGVSCSYRVSQSPRETTEQKGGNSSTRSTVDVELRLSGGDIAWDVVSDDCGELKLNFTKTWTKYLSLSFPKGFQLKKAKKRDNALVLQFNTAKI
ncbi:unnamed protein product [Amoebophrya sp. A25]|nr:unnamed protein product [Amoebophrya sp. A25]|eukprot:GSA25T00023631001.1